MRVDFTAAPEDSSGVVVTEDELLSLMVEAVASELGVTALAPESLERAKAALRDLLPE